MAELTVGYVAGFIALAMVIVQIWSPNAITFILSGLLRDRNTAATWTVAGRALQNSYWPEAARTEAALARGVRTEVALLVKLISWMGALIAIAGFVTPLGLYDVLGPTSSVVAQFQYLKDTSPFGTATPSRSNLSFSRKCSSGDGLFQGPAPCPYSNTVVIIRNYGVDIDYHMPFGYNVSVPQIIRDIYSSGTKRLATTISNYFDIEWRQYKTSRRDYINNGSAFLIGTYRQMDSMIVDNDVQPIEGLIVDTKVGSLGFRNHTIPAGFQHGATWTEDLLFIEPETSCVNTNLTLDFTISVDEKDTAFISELFLTDRGGFVNLNHTYPEYDRDDPQKNPDLQGRAYKAAWLNNALSMVFLNVTNENNSTYGAKAFSYLNSSLGTTFPMPFNLGTDTFDALDITGNWGNYLFGENANYANPFNVTSDNFTVIGVICSGAGPADIANISNIFAACGLMRGTPQRLDGGSSLMFESGSKWSSPLYACASAVKATIKTAFFNFNGTRGLQSLSVTDLRAKVYSGNNTMPLWGVEDSGMTNDEISPVWGLISPSYESYPNISVVRQESLYLPGYSASGLGFGRNSYQNMPASDFAPRALTGAYAISSALGPAVDYTGYSNMAMYVRWQDLSKTPEAASTIVNLIWTDLAAAAVVGTKGVLGPGNAGSPNDAVPIAVQPIVRKIKYQYLFAIPAFILAGMLLLVSFIALLYLIFNRSNLTTMRRHLHQSSTGRIFTVFLCPESCDIGTKSKQWSEEFGKKEIDLSGERPTLTDVVVQPKANGSVVVQPKGDESGIVANRPTEEKRVAERGGESPPTTREVVLAT